MAPSTLQTEVQAALAAGTTRHLARQLISTIKSTTSAEAAEAWRWALAAAFHNRYPRASARDQLALVALVDAGDVAIDGPVKPVLFPV